MEEEQLRSSASELEPQAHPQIPLALSAANPDTKEPTVATINATTLVDIINSVATATGEASEGTLGEAIKPGLQIQLQVHGLSKDGQGGGKAAKKTGKGKPKQAWHYHLGGVRQCRVPLTPEIKEALEVAYVSKIMSKNFRKEGQPEKERIAQITGLEVEKVQEWFKNRRKKEKLLQSRANTSTSCARGQKPHPSLIKQSSSKKRIASSPVLHT